MSILLALAALSLACSAQGSSYKGDGPDDALRLIPVASVYALKALGVESRDGWGRLAVNSAASMAISVGVTMILKETIRSTRPDGTDRHSFPSGHSSFAFCGATILHKEYHDVSPWISVAGYAVATATALDRVRRHRHHWTDALAGAAIGVLSAEAGYRVGGMITRRHDKMDLAVAPNGLSLIVKL